MARNVVKEWFTSRFDGRRREGSLEALISFDGANEMTIKSGYRLKVKKSMQYTRLLRISQAGFLENLHRKMSR